MKRDEPRTFYIRTYGCQMNELDTEIMIGILQERGLTRIDDEYSADLLIFNTCSIRDLAERKALGKIGKLSKAGALRKNRPIIGITGCMANAKKDSLFQKVPNIDFVIGTNNIHDLNSVLDEVLTNGRQPAKVDTRFEHELDYTVAKRDDPLKAFVSIIRGCDKHCTYCIVPYTRGPESSRKPESIYEECKVIVDKGYKEITLLGQNVNSYGKDIPESSTLFHDLLYKIDAIPGLERVRFMTSHPIDITKNLMEAIRDLRTVCEFVHFPIQAGSDRILKKMHRLYSKQEYLDKVHMLREIVPDVAIGTDIIVGFPTETESEFCETIDVLKELKYHTAFLFAYSPRKGTPATRWKDDIPLEVKDERLQRLIEVQEEVTQELRQKRLGETVEVLVEGKSQKESQNLRGRTRHWENVIFSGDESLVGTLQQVKIHSFGNLTMMGDLVTATNRLAIVA